MTRAVPILAALAIGGAACKHAQKAAPPEGQGGGAQRAEIPPGPGRPAVPSSPTALLSRSAIVELQRRLAADGLLGEHREGEIDPATSAALEKFQARHDLATTGFPDRLTLTQLGIDPEQAYEKAHGQPRPSSGGAGP